MLSAACNPNAVRIEVGAHAFTAGYLGMCSLTSGIRRQQVTHAGTVSDSQAPVMYHLQHSPIANSHACPLAGQRCEWRLLFNTQRDGKSYSTLLGRVLPLPGPTLVVVKDSGGHVFGGYAPAAWRKSGTYYGDPTAFLFQLEPQVQVREETPVGPPVTQVLRCLLCYVAWRSKDSCKQQG